MKEFPLSLLHTCKGFRFLPDLIECGIALLPLRSLSRTLFPTIEFSAQPRVLSLELGVFLSNILSLDAAGQLLHLVRGHCGVDLRVEPESISDKAPGLLKHLDLEHPAGDGLDLLGRHVKILRFGIALHIGARLFQCGLFRFLECSGLCEVWRFAIPHEVGSVSRQGLGIGIDKGHTGEKENTEADKATHEHASRPFLEEEGSF